MAGEQSSLHDNEESEPALLVLRAIICCVGLFGNILVIFVIVVLREFRKAVTNWYILQLAIADCCFLLTLPFKMVEDVEEEWRFSSSMCKAKETILFVNYYSSILFLMIMSIDRYIAVCCEFGSKLQNLRTKFPSGVITAIVWIVSLLLSIPIMIYSDKIGIEPNCKCNYDFATQKPVEKCNDTELHPDCEIIYEDKCDLLTDKELAYLYNYEVSGDMLNESEGYYSVYDDGESGNGSSHVYYQRGCSYAAISWRWTAYLLFNFITMFLLPFMLMSVCYSSIALQLMVSKHRRKSITREGSTTSNSGMKTSRRRRTISTASQKESNKRSRVTLVCFVLVIQFLICWLPFHVVHLAKIKGILASTYTCSRLASVTTTIAYLNSALNPYAYNFIGTKFRKRFRSAAGTISSSVKKRANFSVQYRRGSRGRLHSSTDTSHTGTAVIRIMGGEIKVVPSQSVAEEDRGETSSREPNALSKRHERL